jgi:predicted amidohydrolase
VTIRGGRIMSAVQLCEIPPPSLKVTVCQMEEHGEMLLREWDRLLAHVREQASDLVLLPDMPFYPSFVGTPRYVQDTWDRAVDAHDRSEAKLLELAPAAVIATRPLDFGNERYNSGYVWTSAEGPRAVHASTSLRCESGAWEGHWYHSAAADFVPVQKGNATIGFLIGAELWAEEEIRHYRDEAVNVLVTPRGGGPPGDESWIAAGRKAALLAGAFVLSSARARDDRSAAPCGWVIAPNGELIASTSKANPLVAAVLDLRQTESARKDSLKLGVTPP